ncbi:ParE family toxin-like protein, partial [Proteus mirabilis]
YFSGERLCKKVKCGGKKGGVYPVLKIDIGAFWRLLSMDQGQSWKLMSHERYNKMISR